MFAITGSTITQAISPACLSMIFSAAPASLYSATMVSLDTLFGTPADAGTP